MLHKGEGFVLTGVTEPETEGGVFALSCPRHEIGGVRGGGGCFPFLISGENWMHNMWRQAERARDPDRFPDKPVH